MKRIEFIYLLTGFCTICSCTSKANSEIKEVITEVHNTVTEAIAEIVEKISNPKTSGLTRNCCMINILWRIPILIKTPPVISNGKNKGTTGAVGEHPEKADTMVYLTEL